jgi:hypothetical protein
MNEQLLQLANQYKPRGQIMLDELLLSADSALKLADDLERLNIPVAGVNFWYYVTVRDQQILAQDHHELSVSDAILQGDNPVQDSVALAKNFIGLRPPRATFISIIVDAPEWIMNSEQ